jgi:uncharacterized Zn finger protein (UPF0148 family)
MNSSCPQCGAPLPTTWSGGVVKCGFCGNDAQPEPPPPPGNLREIRHTPEQEAAYRAYLQQSIDALNRRASLDRGPSDELALWPSLVAIAVVVFVVGFCVFCFR